jgi:apolipoprotein N-acyltransferase
VLAGLLQRRRLAAGAGHRLGVRHGLAGRHLLVAVHLDARLWRPRGAAGRAAVLGLSAFLGAYYALAAALFRLAAARPVRGAVPVRRPVAHRRTAARHLVHRLSLGRLGLPAPTGRCAARAVDRRYGIGAVAAWLAARLRCPGRGQPRAARGGTGSRAERRPALAACAAVLPAGRAGNGRAARVALLQGNIPQDEKFEGGTGVPLALAWYGEQLRRQPRARWWSRPRPPFRCCPQQLPEGYFEAWPTTSCKGTQACWWACRWAATRRATPTRCRLQAAIGTAYRFDKHHLVPFGEFIPPLFRWFTDLMNIPLGDFNRGDVGQPSFAWQGQRLAPNVCYEDLFGEELAARFADPAERAHHLRQRQQHRLVRRLVAIDQHLHISRMRALEFDRPMIRATNTGATAIIDHRPRVAGAAALHARRAHRARCRAAPAPRRSPGGRRASGCGRLWVDPGLAPVLGALARVPRAACAP